MEDKMDAAAATPTSTPMSLMEDASSERQRARAAAEGPMTHNVRNRAELPEPLMAKVVRASTFESLVALRRVSRDWRAVLAHYAGECQPNPVVRQVLMVANGTDYACHSPQPNDWYRGSMRFPGRGTAEDECYSPTLRASAGGLLLFVTGDAFIVANPLTRAWKELPKIAGKGAEIEAAAMGMCYHAPSKSYMILVAESDAKEDGAAVTAVFYSLAGEWEVIPSMRGKKFTRDFMELVYVNGSFFGAVESFPLGPVLVRYCVQQQRWSLDEVGLPCTSSVNLGVMDGELSLAARNDYTGRLNVWMFLPAEHRWNVVKAEGMSLVQNHRLVKTVFVGDFQYWKTQDYPRLLVHDLNRIFGSWPGNCRTILAMITLAVTGWPTVPSNLL